MAQAKKKNGKMLECQQQRPSNNKRCHRLVITLNEEEMIAIDNYCKRYKRGTKTKARIIRELILAQMIQRYEADQPLLFGADEMW